MESISSLLKAVCSRYDPVRADNGASTDVLTINLETDLPRPGSIYRLCTTYDTGPGGCWALSTVWGWKKRLYHDILTKSTKYMHVLLCVLFLKQVTLEGFFSSHISSVGLGIASQSVSPLLWLGMRYLNNYWMDWHKIVPICAYIHDSQTMDLTDFGGPPDLSSSATMSLAFVVQSEITQLLDGLPVI